MSALNIELANFVLPQAPIKTLWFEFLLRPDSLETHLSDKNCDPAAADLVIQFMNNSNAAAAAAAAPPPPPTTIPINPVTNGSGDSADPNGKKSPASLSDENKKSYALKMLAIKAMCFMRWDLEFMSTKLPLPMQVCIMSMNVNEELICTFTVHSSK